MKYEIIDIVEKGHFFEVQIELPDFRTECHKFMKGQGYTKEKEINGVKKPKWQFVLEKRLKQREDAAKEVKGKKPEDYEKHFKKFRGMHLEPSKDN